MDKSTVAPDKPRAVAETEELGLITTWLEGLPRPKLEALRQALSAPGPDLVRFQNGSRAWQQRP